MAFEAIETGSRAAQPVKPSSTARVATTFRSADQPVSVHAREVSAGSAGQLSLQDMSTNHVTPPLHEASFAILDDRMQWLQDFPQEDKRSSPVCRGRHAIYV